MEIGSVTWLGMERFTLTKHPAFSPSPLPINTHHHTTISAIISSTSTIRTLSPPLTHDARVLLGLADRDSWISRFGDLRIEDVGGDGDCQFRAVASVLYDDAECFNHIRCVVAGQLRLYPAWYEAAPFDVPTGSSYLTVAEFADAIETTSEWGNNATLQACADALGVEIRVLSSMSGGSLIEVKPRDGGGDVPFVYIAHYDEFHFAVVRAD